jgi:predicted ATP-dependent endonuclease of OLD family
MQHPVFGNESEQKAFYRIQALIRDLLDVPDLLVEIPSEQDDIYLTIYGNRLPLASFGTGVHELVIICSTLALHENRVVCIEEPEIHLHPGLLRKFLRFLNTTTNTYFIATHSNVLLDSDEIASVYHVQHDGQCSRVTRSLTTEQSRSVLRDLGYRASDLLQTNGIIWVEGPSDRIYINRWLELSDSKFIEGIRYSIMFYGGACLANLSVTEGAPTEDFIELLRVNSHVVVVIDRDGDSAAEKLKEYKQRILTEAGANKCWITAGREIENYLTPTLLQRYLKSRYQDRVGTLEFHPDDRLDDCIKSAVDGPSFTYSSDKKGYARQICMMMSTEDLDSLDLRSWLKKVHDAIAAWNQG